MNVYVEVKEGEKNQAKNNIGETRKQKKNILQIHIIAIHFLSDGAAGICHVAVKVLGSFFNCALCGSVFVWRRRRLPRRSRFSSVPIRCLRFVSELIK